MKTFITILLTIFASVSMLTAQIPNAGFEQWANSYTPVSWQTTNQMLPAGTHNVIQSPNSTGGDYAIELQTIKIDGMLVPGVATPGELGFGYVSGGVPCSLRPQQVSFSYMHPTRDDEVFVAVMFYKNGNMIGSAEWQETDSTAGYETAELTIGWTSAEYPDTVNMVILTDWNVAGSKIIVDDILFSQTVTSAGSALEQQITVRPNPASRNENIIIDLPHQNVPSEINIFDLSGQKVKNIRVQPGNPTVSFRPDGLKSGMYIVACEASGQVIRQKVMIR